MGLAQNLTQDIIALCRYAVVGDPTEWNDWALFRHGDVTARVFHALANLVNPNLAPLRNPPWLVPANVEDGPYMCMGLQPTLGWPVTAPMRSKLGVFLHPFHQVRGQHKDLEVVLVDTVFNSGHHVREAAAILKAYVDEGYIQSATICKIAVIYSNLDGAIYTGLPKRYTRSVGTGATGIPVVSLVNRADLPEPLGVPVLIANQRVVAPGRL